jgi:hypothetical protein
MGSAPTSEFIVLKIQKQYKEKIMRHTFATRTGAYALAGCLVTSLIVGFSGAGIAQGTSGSTATTSTTKKGPGCRVKRFCHRFHRHHHCKKSTSGTTSTTPAQ